MKKDSNPTIGMSSIHWALATSVCALGYCWFGLAGLSHIEPFDTLRSLVLPPVGVVNVLGLQVLVPSRDAMLQESGAAHHVSLAQGSTE